jgi:predicted MFS family arabinose efflux permease
MKREIPPPPARLADQSTAPPAAWGAVFALSLLLLGLGLAGFAGTILIGRFLKDALYRTLVAIPALMAVIALALIAFGSSLPATAVLLAIWGLVGTAAPVGWWTWLAQTLPRDAEAGGGLMVASCSMRAATRPVSA